MTIQDLKHLIKTGELPNFLVFTGEEYEVRNQYIKQIAKVKGLPVVYESTVADIWNKLGHASLIAENSLYVVYDDTDFITTERAYNKLPELGKDMLILVLNSIDKRLKMLKQYKDSIVEFNTLNEAILKQYIQREIPLLSDRNCEILMEICEHNYGHCLLEIDKINRYWRMTWEQRDIRERDGGMFWINECFKHLLEDGTIYKSPQAEVWDFVDAFLKDKPDKAYQLYLDLLEKETPVLMMLSVLYTTARQVLQVQTCNSKDISKSTGLTWWQINKAKGCVGVYPTEDLEMLLRLIQNTEKGVKTGKLDSELAMDYIFVNYY